MSKEDEEKFNRSVLSNERRFHRQKSNPVLMIVLLIVVLSVIIGICLS